jgi:pimeloyl-ACP methyl ester carboxylesterase
MGTSPRAAVVAILAAGLALPVPTLAAPATAPAASVVTGTHRTATTHDITSPLEAQRTAAAPLPRFNWWDCTVDAECSTVKLPLDYDSPKGPTTEIAVARVKATDQRHKIGTLFVNPGGPGGSGVELAMESTYFLPPNLLERFDVVGFDPRGIGFSDQVRCFADRREQDLALGGFDVQFPWTEREEQDMMKSAQALGKACSTTGKPLSASMSTAQVARDMDMLRKALGDDKLSYLGFSYGSELGLTYATMFPDRVRAITVDGVLDPAQWAGTETTSSKILDERLGSSAGAYKALKEILTRCEATTTKRCPLAGKDPVAVLESIAQRLRKSPVVLESTDDISFTLSYASFISSLLGSLYTRDPGWDVVSNIVLVQELIDPGTPAAERAAAERAFLSERKKLLKSLQDRFADSTDARHPRGFPSRGFPYDNDLEAFSGVTCSDGLHPSDVSAWPEATATLDEQTPYFGRAWGWSTVQCASDTWTVQDEDAYRGPFNRRTASPVLLVGNYWDPATAYTGARSAAAAMPGAHLLSSDSWGHTAYGTSDCVTDAVNNYLLDGTLPAENLTCVGDLQPFTRDLDQDGLPTSSSAAGEGKILPPIEPDPVVEQTIEQLQNEQPQKKN